MILLYDYLIDIFTLDLPRPIYFENVLIFNPRQPLLNTHEFETFRYYNLEKNEHIWDNTQADVGQSIMYKGQR